MVIRMKADRKDADIQLQYREQLIDAKMQISKIDKEMMDLKYRKEQLENERIMILRKQQLQENDKDIFEILKQQRRNRKR